MNISAEHFVEEGIDLRALIVRLWAGRWWIAASVVFFVCAFVALAVFGRPIYRGSAVLVPAETDTTGLGSMSDALGSLGGLASLAGITLGQSGTNVEESLAVLQSREFTEKFIRDERLMPVLFWRKWDARTGTWKVDVEPPTPARAYKYFDKRVRSVLRDKKTGLVTVSIDWRDRHQAAEWANKLVERLNAEMRVRAITHADASVGYLEKELETTALVGARDALSRLMETQIKQRMFANVTQEYAFRVVDKAMAADEDDPVKPNKLLLFAAGPVVGFAIGCIGVLFMQWLSAVFAGLRQPALARQ